MAACISMSLKPDESMVGARAAAKTDRTSTQFYRKLAEAMRHGATITEEIMIDGLTDREAYRIEKQRSSNSISRIVVNCGTRSTKGL
jgi:hypothetical protein